MIPPYRRGRFHIYMGWSNRYPHTLHVPPLYPAEHRAAHQITLRQNAGKISVSFFVINSKSFDSYTSVPLAIYFYLQYSKPSLCTRTHTQVTLVLSSLMLAAVVSAYPQSPESRAVILSQDQEVNPDGTYKTKYARTFF